MSKFKRLHLIRRCLLSTLVASLFATPVCAEEPALRTGTRFRHELNSPLAAKWENVVFREVLTRISVDRGVAVLLDRRIDPNQKRPVVFANQPLKDGLAETMAGIGGGISAAENVIYLGPQEAARKLRTVIALRTEELTSAAADIPKDRQQLWLKPRTVQWDDLDAPLEILDRLQSDLKFQISNLTLVEHDLWAGAVLPDVSGITALSLILIQFDLTFAWRQAGEIVELIPIPASVWIERPHKVKGKSIEKTLAEWQAHWPQIDFRIEDGELIARATVEEHEELDAGPASPGKSRPKPLPTPLDRRQFTLQIKDVPAKSLMDELEKSGIVFDYDPQALADAGIDLNKFVEFNVRKLSAKEFFRAVFDPLGVQCAINGVTVTLTPK